MVTLDSNVYISFVISPKPPLSTIRDAWLDGSFIAALSQDLYDELERVTSYPHLAKFFRNGEREAFLTRLRTLCLRVHPEKPYPEFSDPDDAYLLAMLRAPATELLVTGDKALLALTSFADKPIMSPAAFVTEYLES